jgi:lysophospholipase L1-like esterase
MIAKKNHILKLAGVLITCAVISACSSSDPTAKNVGNSGTPSSGDADFTTFVAIGDSLTAGYADGALYLLGQQNSFPLMLAQQFAAADGVAVSFTQPLVGGNEGALLVGGTAGILENRFVLNTETEKPERLTGIPTEDVTTSGLNGTLFNNMGVPGAKSFHLILAPGYGDFGNLAGGTANPYFARFSSDPFSGNTLLLMDDVVAQIPSFYTLWIGNNDVLGYATTGGDGSDPITPTATFDAAYTGIVGMLTAANPAVQGVLINIPDVSTIPFFTTVPYNAIPLDQATADTLNTSYAPYNAALSNPAFGLSADEIAKRTISFSAGQNAVVIEDETLTPLTGFDPALLSMRQATASDLILLPVSAYLGTEDVNSAGVVPPAGLPWGLGAPLSDADVLIPSEIAAIDAARLAFNATIKTAADNDPNLAFLDAAAIMKQLSETGVDYGTGFVNADFATGGAFSLDGVHPTSQGQAIMANEFIKVINSKFSANIPLVNVAEIPGSLNFTGKISFDKKGFAIFPKDAFDHLLF